MTSKQFGQLILDKWWLVLLILLLISFGIWLFTGSRAIEKLDDEINQQKGVNAVITNQIVNAEKEVNDAKEKSNQAQVDFNTSVNTDSNRYNGNADERFCARFPNDSSCKR